MNSNGIFEYNWFDNYFTDDDRQAFLVKEVGTNKLLGFVMINEYVQKCDKGHSIAEFMIIPKYRRKGIGRQVAEKCFDEYEGAWEVSPSQGSERAYKFWENVINNYTHNNYQFIDGIFVFSV